MKINLIGNALEKKGLWSDACVIRKAMPEHEYTDVQYDAREAPEADVNIFLEVCAPWLHRFALKNILIPNVELYHKTHGQTHYDSVWTKTRHAKHVMNMNGRESTFIGFTSEDIYRPNVKRENKFIHVAGGGRFRNTKAVVNAWTENWKEGDPRLTVVAQKMVLDAHGIVFNPKGIDFIFRVDSRDMFIDLMNEHRYHLLPSQYEGFGASLWEARSCAASLLTTDAAPMNEAIAEQLIPFSHKQDIRRGCLVQGNMVTADAVWEAVQNALKKKKNHSEARKAWTSNHKEFVKTIRNEMKAIELKPPRKTIQGHRNFIVAVMATIPGRERQCARAKNSLEQQGIKVHVWDKEQNGRTDDARKFIFPVPGYRGFILSVDDDLIYPKTYVRDMVDAVEKYQSVVTLHGKSFRPPIKSYYKNPSLKVRCLGDLEDDVRVQVPGTGAMCWHTDLIEFSIKDFPADQQNMADIHVGIKCNEERMPIWALSHTSDYLTYQPVKDTIWDEYHNNDNPHTKLINDTIWHTF